MGALFALKGHTKIYGEDETAVRALADVELKIAEGEFLVLLGRRVRASRPCSILWAVLIQPSELKW